MRQWSPLGAICGGLAAGLVGALAHQLFFSLTRKLAPAPRETIATATQTRAPQVVDAGIGRAPVLDEQRRPSLSHLALWGGAYGIVAGTFPRVRPLQAGLALGFGVWLFSDSLLVRGSRRATLPDQLSMQQHPIQTPLSALAAHVASGAVLAGTFSALGRWRTPATVFLGSSYLTRRVPSVLRHLARGLTARGLRVALPVRRMALAAS